MNRSCGLVDDPYIYIYMSREAWILNVELNPISTFHLFFVEVEMNIIYPNIIGESGYFFVLRVIILLETYRPAYSL